MYNSIFIFDCNLGFVFGKDWRRIVVYKKSIQPQSVKLLENNQVTLYCGSTTSRAYWTFSPNISSPFANHRPRSEITSQHSQGFNWITISKPLENDTGYYFCKGTHKFRAFQDFTFLMVYKETPLGLVLPSWIEVAEGDSVTLACGSVKPVKWFSVHFHDQNSTTQGNSLTLHSLKKEHSGRYSCRGIDNDSLQYRVFHGYALIIVDGYAEFTPYLPMLPLDSN